MASGKGTGSSLTKATIIVCGIASLVASLLSFLYGLHSRKTNFSLLFGIWKRLTRISLPDQCGFKRTLLLAFQTIVDVDHSCRKNYRKPLLQRYVIRILLMYGQNLKLETISHRVSGCPSILPRHGLASCHKTRLSTWTRYATSMRQAEPSHFGIRN